MANGLETLEVLQAGSWTAKEREARVKGLLREVDQLNGMDRVDPWVAKAQGWRKAGIRTKLLIRPTKGGMDLRDARRRWTVTLRDSPLVVDRLKAEP